MSESLWKATATCATCGEILNTAEHVPESQKFRVAMTAPIMATCKVWSHNTFKDLNLRVKLEWEKETENATNSEIETAK